MWRLKVLVYYLPRKPLIPADPKIRAWGPWNCGVESLVGRSRELGEPSRHFCRQPIRFIATRSLPTQEKASEEEEEGLTDGQTWKVTLSSHQDLLVALVVSHHNSSSPFLFMPSLRELLPLFFNLRSTNYCKMESRGSNFTKLCHAVWKQRWVNLDRRNQ